MWVACDQILLTSSSFYRLLPIALIDEITKCITFKKETRAKWGLFIGKIWLALERIELATFRLKRHDTDHLTNPRVNYYTTMILYGVKVVTDRICSMWWVFESADMRPKQPIVSNIRFTIIHFKLLV